MGPRNNAGIAGLIVATFALAVFACGAAQQPPDDQDLDGIALADDMCPGEPEDMDGIEDGDGCPETDVLDRDGDNLADEYDECPDDPEDIDMFEDEDGCPDADNDYDGIADVSDACMYEAEDLDDFNDADGCPDDDNDLDKILDVDDVCPGTDSDSAEETQENYNGTDDDDGCPDRGRVVVIDSQIEILDKVYFEFGKAIVKEASYPILDAVAASMEGNPDILLVEIQGHTDSREGDDAESMRLSRDRAEAVSAYLIAKGVETHRLAPQGYGTSYPMDSRSNEAAWARNRRVEFLIVKRVY